MPSREGLSERGQTIYSALYWPYLAASCAVGFVPILGIYAALKPFNRHKKPLKRFTAEWAAHFLERAPYASVEVRGLEKVDADESYIYIANHQSMVDILAIMATRLPFVWVSKVENFYAPFLGWAMYLNEYVPLKRGYLPSIMRMVRTCLRHLEGGESLFIFPEGTRSNDGELKPFFRGAFVLSARSDRPIVPMVLDGTDRVLPKGSFKINPTHVIVSVLDPVHPRDYGHDKKALLEAVRERMIEEQVRLRAERASR